MRIKKIEIRKILNSGGKNAVEVELLLNNGDFGIASCPSAILPGKREVAVTDCNQLSNEKIENLKTQIYKIKNVNQHKLDELLETYINEVGSDITLSISLALARAISNSKKISLVQYISKLLEIKSYKMAPFPLIAIFSGGVHSKNNGGSIQQIMLSVNTNDFNKSVDIILNIYNTIERYLKQNDLFVELGSSSGFVVKNISCDEQFELLSRTIKELGYDDIVSIAVDVAAEHLKNNDDYSFENKNYAAVDFYDLIQNFINKYNITFVEDPFDPSDKDLWIKLKNNNQRLIVVGDDLFATQQQYINSHEANGIIVKMNQVGSLTRTIETIKIAKKNNMKLCVSHRSLETEDTFMCDLAVAINSEYIKIGGPRRNDRIAKYNRLLKITQKF